MIEIKNLTKKYGGKTAVDNISFNIEGGKIYGLLGPNGAGKSTTMNIITGCIAPTEGNITINGYDILKDALKAKKYIGYLPEIPPVYPEMTPYEYLTFVAEAKGVEYEASLRQVREAIELTQLENVKNRLIRNLSKGYRQRVGIAQALIGNPDIIILDEPTVGLDPKQIIDIRDLIRTLGEIKTVIISSHILAEISEICEQVIIINHGKIVANDTIEKLNSSSLGNDNLRISVRGDSDTVRSVLNDIEGILECTPIESNEEGVCEFRLTIDCDTDLRDTIFFAMADKRCAVVAMEKECSTLENIFLALTDDSPSLAKEDAEEVSQGDTETKGEI